MADDRDLTGSSGPIGSESRSGSHRWLFVAVIATALFVAFVSYELSHLLELPPLISSQNEATRDAGEGEFVVAVARTPGGPEEWANWARIISELSKELDVQFTVRYLSKEDEAAQVIAKDKVDLAFVCAHHYVDLAEQGACDGLVTPVIGGSTTSRLQLVVRTDDTAQRIEDLKDSPVAASDKSSLGGYSYLSYLMAQKGLELDGYFSELKLGETQEQNLHDLLAGDVRATVLNTAQTVNLDLSGVRVIAESEPFGCPPVVAASDMDPELKARIKQALLDMDMSAVLPASSAIDGFAELDPSEYEFARAIRGACGHHAEE